MTLLFINLSLISDNKIIITIKIIKEEEIKNK
jgi:hypothetical protein